MIVGLGGLEQIGTPGNGTASDQVRSEELLPGACAVHAISDRVEWQTAAPSPNAARRAAPRSTGHVGDGREVARRSSAMAGQSPAPARVCMVGNPPAVQGQVVGSTPAPLQKHDGRVGTST